MSCTCDVICRLPERCEKREAMYRPGQVADGGAWWVRFEQIVARIEWVAPQAASELREHVERGPLL